ncbi:uncharacterized protein [Primulina eburnea]|uniref:uncharacterized protein n=1 Tax=Primulina eburnea TaxID=1245227 RepID=UPI003C6C07EE
MTEERRSDVKLKLIGRRCGDGRRYNLPSASEVAVLIVGDFDESLDGGDGYREHISFSESKSSSVGRKKVSIREFFAYRLQDMDCESSTILSSRRLFHQFVVDAYTMVESSRLTYIRMNKKQWRCEMYKGLHDALLRSETNPFTKGKHILLPSTFTGGARYMIQNYQDMMAICKWADYSDFFITFTCNQKWQEIVRFVEELRGATCYDDISIFNDVQYRSFRDACYALGLLNYDKEYIHGIIEVPMTHKFYFEALDKSMKDIMRFINPSSLHMPFGGKTVVFRGDFRQILHVIPKGSRQDIVLATINSSCLWRHCKVLRLNKNMRLRNLGSDKEYVEMKKISDWIANLGYGKIGEANDGYETIDIPNELLLKDYNDPIVKIVESTYPLFGNTFSDITYFHQELYWPRLLMSFNQ